MEIERKRQELKSMLESIQSTELLENRIPLINKLADSYICEAPDLSRLVEYLTALWIDSTCLGPSQCMLNMTILQVAARLFELDTSTSLTQLLILGTKASMWSGKHLQWTCLSMEEFQDEEHMSNSSALILESLGFSSTAMIMLIKSPLLGGKLEILIVENFIFESLSLTKASILENKKIQANGSQLLKVGQMVLDSAIKLCRAYSQAIGWDSCERSFIGNKVLQDDFQADYASHIVSITACTINNLLELGIFAASGGGTLVTVLNASWKGLVSLLQLGKGVLLDRINVGDIILTLISLATESLRCAADAFLRTEDALPISEAKRAFLPVKFYLINAVRIASEYPCEAIKLYQDIVRCVLIISSMGIFMSKEILLASGSEALAELLEPTSYLLVHSLLNAADVKHESKINILGWLFPDQGHSESKNIDEDKDSAVIDHIFKVDCEAVPASEALVLGRVILFLNLLKNSLRHKEEVLFQISKKLSYFLDLLTHEDVYACILSLQVHVLCDSGPNPVVVPQYMFCFLLNSMKTFLIVASTNQAWLEVQSFLFQNLLHPHFICLEIVKELWCFLMRHAEIKMNNLLLGKLCSFLKEIASSEPILMPLCSLRKVARSICIFLTYANSSSVDQVYRSIMNDDDFYLSSIMFIALLMEGFPLNSLTDKLKVLACRKIINAFESFIESFTDELGSAVSIGPRNSSLLGQPVYAMASAIISGEIKHSDMSNEEIAKVLKFVTSLIHTYKSSADNMKDHYRNLVGAILDITSNMKHSYTVQGFGEILLELKDLFITSMNTDTLAYQCKPSLASFMAGLCSVELSEGEDDAVCLAVWDLFHELLRERHWAFIHLALAAFGYFAARTTCAELWRFVPHDAALSFNTDNGHEAKEERFMSELRVYLEKERALCVVTPSKEQLDFLVEEGKALRSFGKMVYTTSEASQAKDVEAKDEDPEIRKKRKAPDGDGFCKGNPEVAGYNDLEMMDKKFVMHSKREIPDGICEGMELMQKGLRIACDSLSQAKSDELDQAFLSHLSCLKDVIAHMQSLSRQ